MIKGGLITPQLVRLGKIVIGEQGAIMTSGKGTQFRPPKKLDHFVVKSLYRDEQGRLVEDQALMARLGKEPKTLRIRLPFNDIDTNFIYELRSYKGGMLFCSGDGESARRRPVTGQKDGKPTYGPPQPFSPCGEPCPLFQARECRRFGALRVILEEQQQVGGIYELRTTSRHSIENILSGLMTVQAQTGGILAWVPLLMKLVPQTVQTPNGGTTKVFVIQIVYDGSPQQLLTEVRDLLAIRHPLMAEIRQLEAGIRALPAVEEDLQESQEMQNEFFPDASEAELPFDDVAACQTVLEAIKLTLTEHGLASKAHKDLRLNFLEGAFGLRSWSRIEGLPLGELRQGYVALCDALARWDDTGAPDDPFDEEAGDVEDATGSTGGEEGISEGLIDTTDESIPQEVGDSLDGEAVDPPSQESPLDAAALPQDGADQPVLLPHAQESEQGDTGTPAYASAGEVAALRVLAKKHKQESALQEVLDAYENDLSVPQTVCDGLKDRLRKTGTVAV